MYTKLTASNTLSVNLLNNEKLLTIHIKKRSLVANESKCFAVFSIHDYNMATIHLKIICVRTIRSDVQKDV